MIKIKKTLILAVILLTTACAEMISPSTYRVSSVGQINKTMRGVIIAARPVEVIGSRNDVEVGTLGGALFGGLAGSQIGGDSTSNAAGAVGGAVVGGMIGDRLEQMLSRQRAIEYVIRTEKGGLINVAQDDDVVLSVGQQVFVLLGEPVRVVPVGNAPSPLYRHNPAAMPSRTTYQPMYNSDGVNSGYAPPPNRVMPSPSSVTNVPMTLPAKQQPQQQEGGYFSYAPQTQKIPEAPRSLIP